MIRRLVKRLFKLYDYDDFVAGGNCGLCGKWIPNEVFPADWPWGICDDHKVNDGE